MLSQYHLPKIDRKPRNKYNKNIAKWWLPPVAFKRVLKDELRSAAFVRKGRLPRVGEVFKDGLALH